MQHLRVWHWVPQQRNLFQFFFLRHDLAVLFIYVLLGFPLAHVASSFRESFLQRKIALFQDLMHWWRPDLLLSVGPINRRLATRSKRCVLKPINAPSSRFCTAHLANWSLFARVMSWEGHCPVIMSTYATRSAVKLQSAPSFWDSVYSMNQNTVY